MLNQEVNEMLTRIGPDTPSGRLLRRYWHPICLVSDLTKENPKKRVQIMGEELVVFRLPTENGEKAVQYGCVAEHCSHRGTSLYYGFVEDDGIRCPYHGWKYDAQGKCIEQPFENNPEFKHKICHPSYPLESLCGMIFVYMGPPEKKPLLPRWDVIARTDGTRLIEVDPVLNCNWLQAMENSVDTIHTYYLHGHTFHEKGLSGGEYYYRPIEEYDWEHCEWGITKSCRYGGDKPEIEIRPPLVFPNILRIPKGPSEALHWRIPIDDTHTQIYLMVFKPSKDGRVVEQPEEPRVIRWDLRTPEGEYDMTLFHAQDFMAWETQGSIFDRSKENLGATDEGITMYRKLLREQIEIVERGGEPMALVRDPEKNQIITFPGSRTPL